ncbi:MULTISPECIES: hypothetical protein [Agrobacterium]|uniref:Uncharacterized protein n=1 Tax=Agrobacterium rubi TaxID=28099 RepID=A0AAE7R7P8_9HYPH|nr:MULTISPECIES: hypothetical protein [Agrobacterium]MBN7807833.1 hypothetical protein [Agrobacterium rosae]NTE89793.1 hypothetical protein [Agrobacterium rubi]NTF05357.1 hypothetical protein [Agrobacterium rubi]NTF10487.1 hypothetical protein [Agrobacterium rubi]NTF22881.1 hypothetical protein [Agrobacterium rubi]
MTGNEPFTRATAEYIKCWQGVSAPNSVALRRVGELEHLIAVFESCRGRMKMEDDAATFLGVLHDPNWTKVD